MAAAEGRKRRVEVTWVGTPTGEPLRVAVRFHPLGPSPLSECASNQIWSPALTGMLAAPDCPAPCLRKSAFVERTAKVTPGESADAELETSRVPANGTTYGPASESVSDGCTFTYGRR